MSLRIGFDVDGTIADMEGALAEMAGRLFSEARPKRRGGEPLGASKAPPLQAASTTDGVGGSEAPPLQDAEAETAELNLTARQQSRLWSQVRATTAFWETLREIEPGSVGRLYKTMLERRWEVIFLTKRPETQGVTSQIQTQRWLKKHGYQLPSVFVVQGSRGRIAASLALDVVVDDRPENCLDVSVESRARPILLWRDTDRPVPAATQRLGIGSVRTLNEAIDLLVQADIASRKKDQGLMGKVLNALGLKS